VVEDAVQVDGGGAAGQHLPGERPQENGADLVEQGVDGLGAAAVGELLVAVPEVAQQRVAQVVGGAVAGGGVGEQPGDLGEGGDLGAGAQGEQRDA
jgi:hypothetical protein